MTGTRQERLRRASLYLIASLEGEPAVPGPLRAAVDAGVRLVQLRVQGADSDRRRAWLHLWRAELPPDLLCLVNDDLEAAFEADGSPLADGVHLGREDAAALGTGPASSAARRVEGLRRARERLGPGRLLGTSVRTLEELDSARAAGADHVGFGAMAASPTRPGSPRADPAELARCVAAWPGFPIFPIGGLQAGNLSLVLRAGCRRAAVGSAILAARDPGAAASELLARLAPRPT